nr:hypothetical protein [Tanacetum cinerariifolium]
MEVAFSIATAIRQNQPRKMSVKPFLELATYRKEYCRNHGYKRWFGVHVVRALLLSRRREWMGSKEYKVN